jgi:thioredoxin 1
MIQKITLEEYEQKVNNKEAFVIDYYTDWCVACQEMMPLVEEIASTATVPFYKVNIDEAPDMKDKARIKAIPMMMMYKEGRMREFVFGKVEKEKIQAKLNRISK